ncbi:MAG TPA: hypothetical protein VLV83_01450 [Acidobacteriota bacterium]|nr:hypothetical protein [Acidobacteriota bacterium]
MRSQMMNSETNPGDNVQRRRGLIIVCVVLTGLAGALNLLDFFVEAWEGGVSGDLIKPMGLAIMFGGLAVSAYNKKLAAH